jgi:ribosome-binding ATPase
MSLKIGIVGLPNVGKSTLFNAVLKKQQALSANYPFATIEPNIGIAEVVDIRVDQLASLSSSVKKTYSTVELVDIAGLVKGAHKGEGLGNQFLANIREVDLILIVLRGFTDSNIVVEGSKSPDQDFEVITTELLLKDLETVTKALESRKKSRVESPELTALEKIVAGIEKSLLIKDIEFSEKEREVVDQFQFLTDKPILKVLNVDEDKLIEDNSSTSEVKELKVSAKLESELSVLSEQDQELFLEELGLKESPLNRIVRHAYKTLGLISFLTTGKDESRAWAIKKGSVAPKAAGVIHTDFESKFIKAKVVDFEAFIQLGGWLQAKETGKLRLEGKDYIVQDGDVIEFMIGS